MTFAEYKKQQNVSSTVQYWGNSITIPGRAVLVPRPPGADLDGDVTEDGKFVCSAYGAWWAWSKVEKVSRDATETK